MEEIWKDITNYEGRYMVSDHGRVKAMNFHMQKGVDRVLKPYPNTDGYLMVDLGRKRAQKVHRIVAATFIGDTTDLVVNHKDFNVKNNHVSNLEIITGFQNSMHYYLDRNEKGMFTSKIIGVHYCKKGKSWISGRRINGKKYCVSLKTEEQARNVSQLSHIDFLEFKANRKLKTA